MKKNHIFVRIAKYQLLWLIIELIAAYGLTQIVIEGSSMIASAIDKLLAGEVNGMISRSFMMKLFLFVGLGFIASLIRDLCASQFSVNIQKKFREEVGRKLTGLEFKYFDQNASGTILHKLTSDIYAVGVFFSEVLPDICCILIQAITIIISIGRMDGMLVLFLAVGYPVVIVTSHFASKRMAHLAKNRWEKIDKLNDKAYDHIQGIVVGRSFNLLTIMEKKIYDVNQEILRFEFMRNRLSSLSWIMQSVVNWLPNIILATLALMRVLSGTITVGEMTYFILMLDRIIHPLSELPSLFNETRELGVSMNRLEEIMEQPDELSGTYSNEYEKKQEMSDSSKPSEVVIEFRNVNFSYSEDTPILHDINFSINEGENIAFVGGSGEGKSTIFKILCGFYQKQSGDYKLYGRAFEKWDINAARGQFALVSQNVFLFPSTIADNVAYGREGATLEEIHKACQSANIHDFIMSLPQQYDTIVGERGARLSGGERQRLSIARAFLKNAPILLLDEPTSAIDVGTEDVIKEAIERISKDKTVITIAHRLSTIEDADTIIVIANGQIVECGKSETLLRQKGVYHHLYEVQKQVKIS